MPETSTTVSVGVGLIFRLAHLPSDPCGASLGSLTFTLILVGRHAEVCEIGTTDDATEEVRTKYSSDTVPICLSSL